MPDGVNILYANGNDLYTARINGGAPQKFASLPGRAYWMRWSPGGKLLRFTVIDTLSHTVGIYELSQADHTAKRILTGFSQPSSECCGVWMADGSSYIFQSSHGGSENLWQLAGNNTTSPRQITDGPLQFQSPVASRTGHTIYFQGVDARSEMLRVSASGDLVPESSFLANAVRVDYSRDGNWVAWVDINGLLWRARTNGSERLQLSPDGTFVFMARWSPDGNRLALMAREPGKAWKIYVMPAAGGEFQPLLNEDRNEADPTWLPDGKTLVFGRLNDLLGKESAERGLYLLHVDTRQVEQLPDSAGLFSPRTSPDGRYIAAMTLNQKELRIFDLGQRTWKTLATNSAADPFWAPDSKSVYVHASLDPSQPIERISVPDGTIKVLVRLSDSRAQGAVDFIFGGVTPDGIPLVRSRVFTGNLFSLDLDK
ncbi:CadC family transcriptional regulator [Granulicella cerasi]|uniref:CadC family transcriptional regulator n=2 Tax=Granulicella cerasi TaxID=741063 RepID=A0ABW1ZAQ0_9BACT